jgi:hypothetical protein
MLLSDAFREAGRGDKRGSRGSGRNLPASELNASGPFAVHDLLGVAVRGMGMSAAEKLIQQFALTEQQLTDAGGCCRGRAFANGVSAQKGAGG